MLETLSILVWDTGCPLWSASPAAMDTLPAVLSLSLPLGVVFQMITAQNYICCLREDDRYCILDLTLTWMTVDL